MEGVEIGRSEFGIPVYLDKYASEADHIAVVNRVKVHTRFYGAIESGLMKMLLIGLGKHKGAEIYHRAIADHTFDEILHSVVNIVLSKTPVAFGLATIENAHEQTARLVGVKPEDFMSVEPELLKESMSLMAKLPFKKGDLLIVDEMGKEFSGLGMDTYVTGVKENSDVDLRRLFVRDLTDKSYGNAQGIGYADVTTRKLVDKIDAEATYVNAITGGKPANARIPLTYDVDREAIDAALATIGLTEPPDAKVMWIRNTLEMVDLFVSEAYLPEVQSRCDLEQMGEPMEMPFDEVGNLPLVMEMCGS